MEIPRNLPEGNYGTKLANEEAKSLGEGIEYDDKRIERGIDVTNIAVRVDGEIIGTRSESRINNQSVVEFVMATPYKDGTGIGGYVAEMDDDGGTTFHFGSAQEMADFYRKNREQYEADVKRANEIDDLVAPLAEGETWDAEKAEMDAYAKENEGVSDEQIQKRIDYYKNRVADLRENKGWDKESIASAENIIRKSERELKRRQEERGTVEGSDVNTSISEKQGAETESSASESGNTSLRVDSNEMSNQTSAETEVDVDADVESEADVESAGGSGDFAEVRKTAEEWSRKLGVPINVHESLDTVPEGDAREALERGVGVTGWFDSGDGSVHLYAPLCQSSEEAEKIAIHECVAHKGLKMLLGSRGYTAFLNGVWGMMSPMEREYYLKYEGVNNDHLKAADEFVAHFAEMEDVEGSRSMWDKICGVLRRVARRLGLNLTSSEAEIRDMLRRSYQNMRAGKIDITQDTDGNRKMYDAAKGSGVQFRLGDSASFAERQKAAVENRGTVTARLNDMEVKVVYVPRHDFEGDKPIEAAKAWSRENL